MKRCELMAEHLNIHARWGARTQNVSECSRIALDCLQRLARADDVFSLTWLLCGWSRSEALSNSVRLSEDELQRLLIAGRNCNDDGTVIPELGFSLGRLWNGRDNESAHITINCGAYPDPKYSPSPNDVLVELPYEGPASLRLKDRTRLVNIIESIVTPWNPDWLRVSTYGVDESLYGQGRYAGQKVGWLTYVSDRYGPLPSLPESTLVSRLGIGGSLIEVPSLTLTSFMTEEGVTLLRQISDILRTARFLEPIPGSQIARKL